jgi:hypothetical protein
MPAFVPYVLENVNPLLLRNTPSKVMICPEPGVTGIKLEFL